jgi:hypothetical protein
VILGMHNNYKKELISEFIIENINYFESDKFAQFRKNFEIIEKIHLMFREEGLHVNNKTIKLMAQSDEQYISDCLLSSL